MAISRSQMSQQIAKPPSKKIKRKKKKNGTLRKTYIRRR